MNVYITKNAEWLLNNVAMRRNIMEMVRYLDKCSAEILIVSSDNDNIPSFRILSENEISKNNLLAKFDWIEPELLNIEKIVSGHGPWMIYGSVLMFH